MHRFLPRRLVHSCLSLFLVTVLAGCASAECQQTRGECQAWAMATLDVGLEDVAGQRPEAVKVRDAVPACVAKLCTERYGSPSCEVPPNRREVRPAATGAPLPVIASPAPGVTAGLPPGTAQPPAPPTTSAEAFEILGAVIGK